MNYRQVFTLAILLLCLGCNSGNVANYSTLAKPNGEVAPLPRSKTELIANSYFVKGHQLRSENKLALSAENFKLAYYSLSETDPDYAKDSLANEYGLSLMKIGKLDEAIAIFIEAKSYNQKSNDKLGVAISNLNLGDAYRRLKENNSALIHWEESLVIAKEIDHKVLINELESRIGNNFPNQTIKADEN